VPEVVHAELHLEPVLGLPLWDARQTRMVHEDVDRGMAGEDRVRGLRQRGERGEVEWQELERGVRDLLEDVPPRLLGLVTVARGHNDVLALAPELASDLEPDAAVRARDDGDLAGLVGDVLGGPGHGGMVGRLE